MISLSAATRVFIVTGPTDMRKSFNGLYAIVRGQLQEDPASGHVFVFCNRAKSRIKLLLWDGSPSDPLSHGGDWILVGRSRPKNAPCHSHQASLHHDAEETSPHHFAQAAREVFFVKRPETYLIDDRYLAAGKAAAGG